MFANSSIAKTNLLTALAGSFAGPLFNVLIGLSVSESTKAIEEIGFRDNFELDRALFFNVLFQMAALVATFLVVKMNHGKIKKYFAFVLLGVYTCFMLFVVIHYFLG